VKDEEKKVSKSKKFQMSNLKSSSPSTGATLFESPIAKITISKIAKRNRDEHEKGREEKSQSLCLLFLLATREG